MCENARSFAADMVFTLALDVAISVASVSDCAMSLAIVSSRAARAAVRSFSRFVSLVVSSFPRDN